jgi:hypothetical protein
VTPQEGEASAYSKAKDNSTVCSRAYSQDAPLFRAFGWSCGRRSIAWPHRFGTPTWLTPGQEPSRSASCIAAHQVSRSHPMKQTLQATEINWPVSTESSTAGILATVPASVVKITKRSQFFGQKHDDLPPTNRGQSPQCAAQYRTRKRRRQEKVPAECRPTWPDRASMRWRMPKTTRNSKWP